MPAGRPPAYTSADELQDKIAEYFEQCEDQNRPPTISGLALHTGFESRQSFYDYEKKEEFTYTIKKARLLMESIYEEKLHGNSNAGAIFALKNFGWSDRQEIDHTTGGEKMNFVLNVKPDK